jgi:hypothetical protein
LHRCHATQQRDTTTQRNATQRNALPRHAAATQIQFLAEEEEKKEATQGAAGKAAKGLQRLHSKRGSETLPRNHRFSMHPSWGRGLMLADPSEGEGGGGAAPLSGSGALTAAGMRASNNLYESMQAKDRRIYEKYFMKFGVTARDFTVLQ